MKRVNLLEYFELAEALHTARRSLSADMVKGGTIWITTFTLVPKLKSFVADDNGFSTSKRVANDLSDIITSWTNEHVTSSEGWSSEKLDQEFNSWEFNAISGKIDAFKSVFAAECGEVDVYSVGQVGIYRTSSLVSEGSAILPAEVRSAIPEHACKEFDDAGRCLAFDLPTACGFHALRALELVMDTYLKAFGVSTASMKSWNDYISAAKKLAEDDQADHRPSKKVAAMLDRMRELDRNPLMHPRDTLDDVSANMLFNLSAITICEIHKDMRVVEPFIPGLAPNQALVLADDTIRKDLDAA